MQTKATKFIIIGYILIELFSFVNYTIFEYFNNINSFFTFFVLTLLFFVNINKISSKILAFIAIITVFSAIFMLFTGGTVGSLINIFNVMLGITLFSHIKLDKGEKKIITGLLILILVLFYAKCKDAFYLTQYFKGKSFNSNTVAIVIMIITLIFSVLLERRNTNKILIIILNVVSIIFILQAKSRGSALGILTFLILFLFKSRLNEKIYFIIFTTIIILGTIFPIVYVQMYENNINLQIPFTGKSLYTGREYLWSKVINEFNQDKLNYIFGLGSDYTIEGLSQLNIHNMYWGICVNFGIIVFLLLMKFVKSIMQIKVDIKYALPMISILLLGFFETVILWPATLILIFLLINVISVDEAVDNKMVANKK